MNFRTPPQFLIAAVALTTLMALPAGTRAATVWTGPNIIFSKASGADQTLPANQDKLTDLVKLTRASSMGMYNIAREASFSSTSPKDTLWATSITSPSQTITATNYAALTFGTWQNAYGGSGSLGTNITALDAVVHLVTDDIYLNLRFTNFQGGGSGGAFTYTRSTPVPEPDTIALALVGLGIMGAIVRIRRRVG